MRLLSVLALAALSCMFFSMNTPAIAADSNQLSLDIVPAAPAAKDLNSVAITVNGTQIKESDIEDLLAPQLKQMAGRVPENMMPQYTQQLRKQAVERLVIDAIVTQDEAKQNIVADTNEIKAQIDKDLAAQNLSMDDFKALLKAYGVDFSTYQENIAKRVRFEKLMETKFAGRIGDATDEQISDYYQQNSQQFTKPERIHTAHILVKPEGDDPNAAKAAAKTKAEDLLKQVKEGADFAQLAKENSACPSSQKGGDLGIQNKGTFVPEFEKAAYGLEPNEISDVVETQFGYHIIKMLEKFEAETVSLEDAKADIKEQLSNQQKQKIVMDYIEQAKASADIKFTNPADNFMPAPVPAEVKAGQEVGQADAEKLDKTAEKKVDKKSHKKDKSKK